MRKVRERKRSRREDFERKEEEKEVSGEGKRKKSGVRGLRAFNAGGSVVDSDTVQFLCNFITHFTHSHTLLHVFIARYLCERASDKRVTNKTTMSRPFHSLINFSRQNAPFGNISSWWDSLVIYSTIITILPCFFI